MERKGITLICLSCQGVNSCSVRVVANKEITYKCKCGNETTFELKK